MKAGYKVEHYSYRNHNVIMVENYQESNRVAHYGFQTMIDALMIKENYSVGVWKIKNIKK